MTCCRVALNNSTLPWLKPIEMMIPHTTVAVPSRVALKGSPSTPSSSASATSESVAFVVFDGIASMRTFRGRLLSKPWTMRVTTRSTVRSPTSAASACFRASCFVASKLSTVWPGMIRSTRTWAVPKGVEPSGTGTGNVESAPIAASRNLALSTTPFDAAAAENCPDVTASTMRVLTAVRFVEKLIGWMTSWITTGNSRSGDVTSAVR
eukprot:3938440-Rhodomonas_salina.1